MCTLCFTGNYIKIIFEQKNGLIRLQPNSKNMTNLEALIALTCLIMHTEQQFSDTMAVKGLIALTKFEYQICISIYACYTCNRFI